MDILKKLRMSFGNGTLFQRKKELPASNCAHGSPQAAWRYKLTENAFFVKVLFAF
jgi:hypothetical protein